VHGWTTGGIPRKYLSKGGIPRTTTTARFFYTPKDDPTTAAAAAAAAAACADSRIKQPPSYTLVHFSSSSSSNLGKEQQVLMQQQKHVSEAMHHQNPDQQQQEQPPSSETTTTTKQPPPPSSSKLPFKTQVSFVRHQQRVFDEMANTFASGELVPTELHPVYQQLAQKIIITESSSSLLRILDVACGTGALWPFLAQVASTNNVTLDITGIDLSPKMVEYASQRADQLFQDFLYTSKTKHAFFVVQTDVLEYQPISQQQQQPPPSYDCIIINASFGNFWNPKQVLEHLIPMLKASYSSDDDDDDGDGGRMIISHPLGADFVRQLHEQDASVVPHTLPTRDEWIYETLLSLPLQLQEYVEEIDTMVNENDDKDASSHRHRCPMYCAILQRVRARTLSNVWRFRGSVATGYGRGGKQLGFPTANLPGGNPIFSSALETVTPGVYFGFAVIEQEAQANETMGRNVIHKAVVNVGYSPTFQGQENPEKIIEAHLLLSDDESAIPDFYGATLRLQLLGFLRPEQKFPSFNDLIAQIRADAKEARTTLDREPYACFQSDPFLQSATTTSLFASSSLTTTTWSGLSNGNEIAGWETEDIRTALQKLRTNASRRN
jgi:riboflavin kinase